jgi:hypothetical protein
MSSTFVLTIPWQSIFNLCPICKKYKTIILKYQIIITKTADTWPPSQTSFPNHRILESVSPLLRPEIRLSSHASSPPTSPWPMAIAANPLGHYFYLPSHHSSANIYMQIDYAKVCKYNCLIRYTTEWHFHIIIVCASCMFSSLCVRNFLDLNTWI